MAPTWTASLLQARFCSLCCMPVLCLPSPSSSCSLALFSFHLYPWDPLPLRPTTLSCFPFYASLKILLPVFSVVETSRWNELGGQLCLQRAGLRLCAFRTQQYPPSFQIWMETGIDKGTGIFFPSRKGSFQVKIVEFYHLLSQCKVK